MSIEDLKTRLEEVGQRGELDADARTEASLRVAASLWERTLATKDRQEKKQQRLLSRILDDPLAQTFSTLLTDRVPRASSAAETVRQARHVLKRTGIPGSFSWFERAQLFGLKHFGGLLSGVAAKGLEGKIRAEARPFLLPNASPAFEQSLNRVHEEGIWSNVNHLGEAVLGEKEAEKHLADYIALLRNPEVGCISVKVSSICEQLSALAYQDSLERVCVALRRLYDVALEEISAGRDKILMLDMEAYRDLELTCDAFVKVLSEPRYHALRAGIVLQAYIPDSHAQHERILAFAKERLAKGGSPIRMRIVKGANLEMERVESAQRHWALPIYESKAHSDASFKAMLERAITAENLAAVQLGVASHNLFDIAFSLVLRYERQIESGLHFEALYGMAGALARVLLELDEKVLLYCPTVPEAHLHVAVAYLVRRLDENTAEENFLRHSLSMEVGNPAWRGQEAAFRKSRELQRSLSTESKRRGGLTSVDARTSFENIGDVDFVMRESREWIAPLLESRKVTEDQPLSLFVAGEEIARATEPGFDPSRPGFVPYRMTFATAEEVQSAIEAGTRAHERFSKTSVEERAELLFAAAEALAHARGELIAASVMDGGKNVEEADVEVSEAIDFANYYAHCAIDAQRRAKGKLVGRGLTVVVPPWNFPLAIPLGGVFAALAMGNAVILKPARETALIATEAVKILYSAGIPQEVLQLIVATDEVATELIVNDAVQTVVLTGGTDTARLFRRLRPGLHLLAETGGKNATIVSENADRDLAIDAVVASAFRHAGQKCSATSLLILPPGIYDDVHFRAQLVDAAASLPVGSAWDLASRVTPLVQEPSETLRRGLTTLQPGEEHWLKSVPDETNPRLWSPAIRGDVKPGSYAHQTEFFGPVLSVLRAKDLDDAFHIANGTPYGLTSGFHSLNEGEQARYRETIQAGNLYLNRGTTGAIVRRQPFGGRKASNFGPGAKAGGPDYVLQFAREVSADVSVSAALMSYQEAYSERYAREHDPSSLLGQDNILRYQPIDEVLLVLGEGFAEEDAQLVRQAINLCGARHREVMHDQARDISLEGIVRIRVLGEVGELPFDVGDLHVERSPVSRNGWLEMRKYVLEQSVCTDVHRYGHIAELPAKR